MMKKAKKLLALLLAGVLALGVLTGCSGGGAGPLTKENVTDYIIDYYKASMGVQLTEDTKLKSVADNVLAYVNKEIGADEYKNMPTQQAFWEIVGTAEMQTTMKGWFKDVQLEEGYEYYVNYASTDESYKTELFSQGKTAVIAMTLAGQRVEIANCQWEQPPTAFKTDGTVCVVSGKVKDQNCMISILKVPTEDVKRPETD